MHDNRPKQYRFKSSASEKNVAVGLEARPKASNNRSKNRIPPQINNFRRSNGHSPNTIIQTRARRSIPKTMSTEAQIAANRANAELSTGPTTEEGKAASSRNHFSHGLCTYDNIFFILPFESAEAYSLLRATLLHEHRPETEIEHLLVDRMAQHHWLRSRAEAFESGCFKEDGTLDDKRLALFMRYRTSHERAFHKC